VANVNEPSKQSPAPESETTAPTAPVPEIQEAVYQNQLVEAATSEHNVLQNLSATNK